MDKDKRIAELESALRKVDDIRHKMRDVAGLLSGGTVNHEGATKDLFMYVDDLAAPCRVAYLDRRDPIERAIEASNNLKDAANKATRCNCIVDRPITPDYEDRDDHATCPKCGGLKNGGRVDSLKMKASEDQRYHDLGRARTDILQAECYLRGTLGFDMGVGLVQMAKDVVARFHRQELTLQAVRGLRDDLFQEAARCNEPGMKKDLGEERAGMQSRLRGGFATRLQRRLEAPEKYINAVPDPHCSIDS